MGLPRGVAAEDGDKGRPQIGVQYQFPSPLPYVAQGLCSRRDAQGVW